MMILFNPKLVSFKMSQNHNGLQKLQLGFRGTYHERLKWSISLLFFVDRMVLPAPDANLPILAIRLCILGLMDDTL
jgi:hypothetical protein